MLTYALDKTAGVSLYEQLYRRVKEDILSGRLAAGEKLPSKRALAAHLEVSVITVKNAYEQLMAEGYLTGVEKKGYFVSSVLPPLPSQPPPVTQDAPEPGERTWFLDLVTNSIDAEDFPFTVWARLMRQTILEQGTGLLHPTPPQGAWALRRAIADHLRQFRGMAVGAEQIIVGAGTEVLYSLLVQLLGREPTYGVEDPGYGKIARIYRACGASVAAVPLDGDGLSVQELRRSGADVVHISPSHHYPTGCVMPIARRQELLHWAETELKPKAALAARGEGAFSAGEHCRFCKVKATCRKRAEYNLQLAKYDFAMPDKLTDTEIETILATADQLTAWVADVKEYALQQSLQGKTWKNWKLVEGRARRAYCSETAAAEAVQAAGFDPYEHKVLGITAMTRMLGKKKFEELLGNLLVKPQGKPTLVPLSDKRPAWNTAQVDFKE